MQHSKRPHRSPVTYPPSPRSGLGHLRACHLWPLSAQRRASGYQDRVHINHELLITCPQGAIPHDFLSDRLSTWGSTARRLCPPLLFTFHLSPGLAQRVIDTLPKPSAHTLATWQTGHPAKVRPLFSTSRDPARKRHFCMTSNSHLAPVPVRSAPGKPARRTAPGPLARSLARPTLFGSIMKQFGRSAGVPRAR